MLYNLYQTGKTFEAYEHLFVTRGEGNREVMKDWLEQESGRESKRTLALFPEGTVGNGKAMLPFKTGAFLPGVPVQPLLIEYNNKYDTLTWAWKGIGAFQLVLLTFSQPYTRVTLRYLPVYYPNQEEKEDSRLFAKMSTTTWPKNLELEYLNTPSKSGLNWLATAMFKSMTEKNQTDNMECFHYHDETSISIQQNLSSDPYFLDFYNPLKHKRASCTPKISMMAKVILICP